MSDPAARLASPKTVAVWAADPAAEPAARQLAESLGVPCHAACAEPPRTADAGLEWLLVLGPERLELRCPAEPSLGPLWVDFQGSRGARRRTGGARGDDLARAVGLGPPRPFVLDATAGLGRDAWLLANLGFRVVSVERSPVVAALLADGLQRARQDPRTDSGTLERFELLPGDAHEVLAGWPREAAPDVVLIDPMYPPSRRSALPRKDMRLLARLLGQQDNDDAAELLDLARSVARRVVVKRHLRDAPLGGARPTHARSGRSTRFDVYVAGAGS